MDIQAFPIVIVGSGFLGAVIAERITNELKLPVLVVEKRPHIGGNCFSTIDEQTGIEYHVYGTHIFHTSNANVWNYINQFTTFNSYRHQVLANVKGNIYQLPINLETINSFFNVQLKPFEVTEFLKTKIDPSIITPQNFEEAALMTIGKDLYEAFFLGYSQKQWQIHPKELPASIFARLPFRTNYDESYYFDTWQGIPTNGYTAIFEKLLSNPLCKVMLNTNFFDIKHNIHPNATIVYSGPIDQYFNYSLGKLDWRTLHFEKFYEQVNDWQGNSVINFPDVDISFTRIHEPKHLHPERTHTTNSTLLIKEFSALDNGSNPYYPIPDTKNTILFKKYKELAQQEENVIIAGRLGDYKYYDMHQTIERALELFERVIYPKYNNYSNEQ
jgi:UDP-galactopyranose mutase